jgi:hypothetical protein
MFGDFSVGKNWHSHYSAADLRKLFDGRFEVQKLEYFGLFMPFFYFLEFLSFEIFGRSIKFLEKIIEIDQKIKSPRLSYLLMAKCKKVSSSSQ